MTEAQRAILFRRRETSRELVRDLLRVADTTHTPERDRALSNVAQAGMMDLANAMRRGCETMILAGLWNRPMNLPRERGIHDTATTRTEPPTIGEQDNDEPLSPLP